MSAVIEVNIYRYFYVWCGGFRGWFLFFPQAGRDVRYVPMPFQHRLFQLHRFSQSARPRRVVYSKKKKDHRRVTERKLFENYWTDYPTFSSAPRVATSIGCMRRGLGTEQNRKSRRGSALVLLPRPTALLS